VVGVGWGGGMEGIGWGCDLEELVVWTSSKDPKARTSTPHPTSPKPRPPRPPPTLSDRSPNTTSSATPATSPIGRLVISASGTREQTTPMATEMTVMPASAATEPTKATSLGGLGVWGFWGQWGFVRWCGWWCVGWCGVHAAASAVMVVQAALLSTCRVSRAHLPSRIASSAAMKKVLSPISLRKMREKAARKPLRPRGPLRR
jgi:hypothetical protein